MLGLLFSWSVSLLTPVKVGMQRLLTKFFVLVDLGCLDVTRLLNKGFAGCVILFQEVRDAGAERLGLLTDQQENILSD